MSDRIRDQRVLCDNGKQFSSDRRQASGDFSTAVHRNKLRVGSWKNEKIRFSLWKVLDHSDGLNLLAAHHIHRLTGRKIQLSVAVFHTRNKEDRERAYILDKNTLCRLRKVLCRCRGNNVRDLCESHVGGDHSGRSDLLYIFICNVSLI